MSNIMYVVENSFQGTILTYFVDLNMYEQREGEIKTV